MGLRKGYNGTIKEEIRLFKTIYEMANSKCLDPSTVNGAVLVPHKTLFSHSIGNWNAPLCPTNLLNREEKYKVIQHAERNLIYSAIGHIEFTKASLYITWLPCIECAKTIIGVGIKKVIIHEHQETWNVERWIPQMKDALNLFEKCGVSVRFFKHKIGISTLFNGKVIKV